MRFGKAGSRQRVVTRPDGIAARLERRKHVLVVESATVIAQTLDAALGPSCHVFRAHDAAQALSLAASQSGFDVLVLEMSASSGDGLALARQLRALPHLTRTPLVFVDAPNSAVGADGLESQRPMSASLYSGPALALSEVAERVVALLREPE